MTYIEEQEYILKIDASFPYKDEAKWKALIEEGASISPNASYMALHEICSLPNRSTTTKERHCSMLAYWQKHNDQPLQQLVLRAAKCLIENNELSRKEAKESMLKLKDCKNQYNALAIILYAGGDRDRKLNDVYNEVVNHWKKA